MYFEFLVQAGILLDEKRDGKLVYVKLLCSSRVFFGFYWDFASGLPLK